MPTSNSPPIRERFREQRPKSGENRLFSGAGGGAGGIRTLDTLLTYTHFPGVRLRPLGHCSVSRAIHHRSGSAARSARPSREWMASQGARGAVFACPTFWQALALQQPLHQRRETSHETATTGPLHGYERGVCAPENWSRMLELAQVFRKIAPFSASPAMFHAWRGTKSGVSPSHAPYGSGPLVGKPPATPPQTGTGERAGSVAH
jgi:hypothetical protein